MGICQCTTTILNPKPKCNANCIYTPNMISENVTFCDSLGIINIEPILTLCGSIIPQYSIHSFSNVTDVAITPTQITFAPVNTGSFVAEIKYKIKCGLRSDIGTITIIYKNECIDKTCGTGFQCNPCTGICEVLPPDLSTGVSDGTPDLSTN